VNLLTPYHVVGDVVGNIRSREGGGLAGSNANIGDCGGGWVLMKRAVVIGSVVVVVLR